MSQFTRTRVRCKLEPAKVGQNFTTLEGTEPKIYKNAGVEFEFALFNGNDLFDVSNVASITVSVKPKNNPAAAALMLKTISAPDINLALNPGGWNNGTDQHVVVPFLGTETGLADGTYDLTVSGFTNDNAIDPDVFAISSLVVKDAGITGLIAPAIDASTGVTLAALQGLLAQYVTYIMPNGKTLTFSDDAGRVKRILGVSDNNPAGAVEPVRIDSLEQ